MELLLEATYRAEATHFWFRGLRYFSEPLIRQALAGVSNPQILDCGCGTGANMKRLSTHGRVAGFDVTMSGLEFAKTYDQRRLARASATDIPFASGRFDLVTAFDIFACLTDQQERQTVAEMFRVLRPGGAALINTAALPALRGQHSVFAFEVRRATRRTLRPVLETAGFRIERMTYTNFSLLPLVLPVRVAQRMMGLTTPEESGADIAVPPAFVNRMLSGLLRMEAIALRGVDMPLGSSLLTLARKPA